jgi:cell division transport system permease protein
MQSDNVSANKRTRRSFLSRFLTHHSRAAKSALHEMIFMPSSSFVTSLVIGIAMALPLGLYVMLDNINSSALHVNSSPTLTVYLSDAANSDMARSSLITSIKALKTVKNINYISPDEGLKEFQSENSDASWMATMTTNPLPGVLIITPAFSAQDAAALQALSSTLQEYTGVDMVQLDSEWVERFSHMLLLAQRLSFALSVLFGTGVIIITANAIRLTTSAHDEEMQVLRLIGAAHSYIRRPLLYRGALYGFTGAVIALALVRILIYWLSAPIAAIAQSYETIFSLHSFYLDQVVCVLACGASLGFLGSLLALSKRLRQRETI